MVHRWIFFSGQQYDFWCSNCFQADPSSTLVSAADTSTDSDLAPGVPSHEIAPHPSSSKKNAPAEMCSLRFGPWGPGIHVQGFHRILLRKAPAGRCVASVRALRVKMHLQRVPAHLALQRSGGDVLASVRALITSLSICLQEITTYPPSRNASAGLRSLRLANLAGIIASTGKSIP